MLRALVTSGKLRGPASVPRQQGADGADLLMGKANSEDFVPSLAYGITGSNNDTDRIYRLLLATYHPRNYYAVHIDDAESALALRTKLAAHPVLAATVAVGAAEAAGSGEYVTVTGGAGRIHVIMDPEMVTVEGGSHLASSSGFSPPPHLASPSWTMWSTTGSTTARRVHLRTMRCLRGGGGAVDR
ncbi:hypothetical protein CLOP_g10488 [Closterium sp. NIES-67]|nr:hypothetical protein CLOP_g10488 [Closterium sp. NIES-67]